MKFSGPLEDRIAIREFYDIYADGSCRGDREGFLSLWADDEPEWNSHIFDNAGIEAIAAQWDALWAGFENVCFLGQMGPIEVSGDTARVRSYAREVIRLKDGGLFKLAGQYDDQLVRQNGEWRFKVRSYKPLVLEPPEA